MTSKAFLLSVIERAVKTFAQAEAALLLAAGTDLITTDWVGSLSASGMAALLSVLTSVATASATGGPSATGTEQVVQP